MCFYKVKVQDCFSTWLFFSSPLDFSREPWDNRWSAKLYCVAFLLFLLPSCLFFLLLLLFLAQSCLLLSLPLKLTKPCMCGHYEGLLAFTSVFTFIVSVMFLVKSLKSGLSLKPYCDRKTETSPLLSKKISFLFKALTS